MSDAGDDRATKKFKHEYNNVDANPLLSQQTNFLSSLPTNTKQHFFSDNHVSAEDRADVWSRQAEIGEDLVNKYAWATPDDRAISILKHFSPIVEIGCGANAYWSNMMKRAGIDVMAYDVAVDDGGKILEGSIGGDGSSSKSNDQQGTKRKLSDYIKDDYRADDNGDRVGIQHGGPEVLSADPIAKSGRTLFLCYPDEDDGLVAPFTTCTNTSDENESNDDESDEPSPPVSMGAACLEHYQGDTIIHVGELHGDTLSLDQAPWGRSSSPEFQQRLAAEYHCLLKASLPGWLHVRDTISVWKRAKTCAMVFEGDIEENESNEEIEYKYVPPEERLPQDVAAPCLQHLLKNK